MAAKPGFPRASSSADARLDALRVPPHSIEAEQSVLGGLMLDNTAWDRLVGSVGEQDFYRHDHRLIFRAIATLADANQPFDVVTVSEWLESNGHLADTGGLAYLSGLVLDTPTAANILAYAGIVRERALLRGMIQVGTQIAASAYQPEGRSSRDLLDEAEQQVFALAERGTKALNSYLPIPTLLAQAVDRIDELHRRNSIITGLATGFTELDEMTSGLQKGDLVIVAGRPSMGKTSFVMNIVEEAALQQKGSCAVFSMEMSGVQLAMRMLSSLSRVDMQRIRSGRLEDEDWPRVASTLEILDRAKIYVDDGAALSPTEVRARARRIQREHGLDLIVVDYLQLMQVPGTEENRATEISAISRGLKALAKELQVPVIALSQLNRSLEQRPNKRPVMSDLRESGGIEQDADLILFIYRDEVYNAESEDKGVAEIIIGKQRNGPIGTRKLTFLGQYTRFENYADPQSYGRPF